MSKIEISPPVKADSGVLVIGGGIAGITEALELAQMGLNVTLVEKETTLGGLAGSFCCKASAVCRKCFACLVDKRIRDIGKRTDISILTQTELVGLNVADGRYRVTLRQNGTTSEKVFAAVVVAAGIEPFDARLKGEYGYGQIKNVITARDLEMMLRERDSLTRPSDALVPQKIAFIQCVGSRDKSVGNLYCSQVCCAYALRMISLLRQKYPESEITLFYMDIQPAGVNFAEFLRRCREDGKIRFVRSIPSKVYQVPRTDNLLIRYADGEQGEVREEQFELLVLSVGMTLPREVKSLAALAGIGCGEEGFLDGAQAKGGLFVAGACGGPKDIEHSIIQAKSTAANVYQYLQGRS